MNVQDVECDELWAFIRKKQKRVRPTDDPNLRDAYAFVAIERNSKLILNFAIGKRDQATTDILIEGLRAPISSNDFQVTTDGFAPYPAAIEYNPRIEWTSHNSSTYTRQLPKVKHATLPPR